MRMYLQLAMRKVANFLDADVRASAIGAIAEGIFFGIDDSASLGFLQVDW